MGGGGGGGGGGGAYDAYQLQHLSTTLARRELTQPPIITSLYTYLKNEVKGYHILGKGSFTWCQGSIATGYWQPLNVELTAANEAGLHLAAHCNQLYHFHHMLHCVAVHCQWKRR